MPKCGTGCAKPTTRTHRHTRSSPGTSHFRLARLHRSAIMTFVLLIRTCERDRLPTSLARGISMHDIDVEHLKAAISVARRAREKGNHPFGAVLVDQNNRVILQAENTVVTGRDCTGHAETNLVRLAAQQFSPEQLTACTLYSSTEPCAMCAGAIYWSQIGQVVYALSETDLYAIIGPSPEHLLLPCREVFAHSQRHIEVRGPISALETEARAVHEGFWTIQPQDPVHPV